MGYTLYREAIEIKRGVNMFNIKLVDINGDGCVVSIDSHVDTLEEAEFVAQGEIWSHLGTSDIKLRHEHDLIYDVVIAGTVNGAVLIRSLGEKG